MNNLIFSNNEKKVRHEDIDRLFNKASDVQIEKYYKKSWKGIGLVSILLRFAF